MAERKNDQHRARCNAAKQGAPISTGGLTLVYATLHVLLAVGGTFQEAGELLPSELAAGFDGADVFHKSPNVVERCKR